MVSIVAVDGLRVVARTSCDLGNKSVETLKRTPDPSPSLYLFVPQGHLSLVSLGTDRNVDSGSMGLHRHPPRMGLNAEMPADVHRGQVFIERIRQASLRQVVTTDARFEETRNSCSQNKNFHL